MIGFYTQFSLTSEVALSQMDKRDVEAEQSNMKGGETAGGGFANPGEHGLGGGYTGTFKDLTGGETGGFKDLTGEGLQAINWCRREPYSIIEILKRQ